MTQKYTPGKWDITIQNRHWDGNQELGDREVVYIINRFSNSNVRFGSIHATDEELANARLIAASPMLYEALQVIHEHLRPKYPRDHYIMKLINKIFDYVEGSHD